MGAAVAVAMIAGMAVAVAAVMAVSKPLHAPGQSNLSCYHILGRWAGRFPIMDQVTLLSQTKALGITPVVAWQPRRWLNGRPQRWDPVCCCHAVRRPQ